MSQRRSSRAQTVNLVTVEPGGFELALPCPAVLVSRFVLRLPMSHADSQDLGRRLELRMSFFFPSAAVDAVRDAGDRFGRLAEEHHL